MGHEDVRWWQRLDQFSRALAQLKSAVELANRRELSELEEQGLIQSFEFTHELAWNAMKDFLESRGVRNLFGSKDTSRSAFKQGLIDNGEVWMEMIKSRNLTTHTYNQDVASEIARAIRENYAFELQRLCERLEKIKSGEQT